MLRNYIKIAWRNLWKNKGYTTINILGLSFGLTSFLILLLYLNHELSYDRWNPELEKVYKVSLKTVENEVFPRTQAPLAALLLNKAPQIEASTKISTDATFEVPLAAGDNMISQAGVIAVDSLFFKVFPYKIIKGDARFPLNRPSTIVINEQVSSELFGQQDPIGKTIKIFNGFECEVTAVMESPKSPTHLEANVVFRSPFENSNNNWANSSFYTYIKTKSPVANEQIESVIDRIFYTERIDKEKNIPYETYLKSESRESLFVDAVHDIHNFPKHGESNITSLSLLLLLSILLLLAGAINFSNLSIATSLERTKEIGLKKIFGSSRSRLFWQFMSETALQCLIVLILSIFFLQLILPYFNREFQLSLRFFTPDFSGKLLLQIATCLLLTIIFSGIYPAIFLSNYNPTKILKGNYSTGSKGVYLRNTLIIVQFAVATFFITSIIVISRQVNYMQDFDKGFTGDQVLRLQALNMTTREANFERVKNDLLSIPGILSVSKTTKVPGDGLAMTDTSTMPFKHKGQPYRMSSVRVSKDYFETLNIKIINGRLFNDSNQDQHTRSAIINETAARLLDLKEINGKYLSYPGCDSIPMEIVGIVKDINVMGFEQQVQPTVFTIGNEACTFQSGGAFLLKMEGSKTASIVEAIEKKWKKIEPGFVPRYSFLNDNFEILFANHLRLQRIIIFFAFVAISIAVMGLFALTAFLTVRRTKEISIRKILGAASYDLAMLIGKDFIKLIAIAIVVTGPLCYWAADKWLQSFAYRISMDIWPIVLTASCILIIAIITIGIHIFKATRANIAKNLRNE